jgi:hypothetical protein
MLRCQCLNEYRSTDDDDDDDDDDDSNMSRIILQGPAMIKFEEINKRTLPNSLMYVSSKAPHNNNHKFKNFQIHEISVRIMTSSGIQNHASWQDYIHVSTEGVTYITRVKGMDAVNFAGTSINFSQNTFRHNMEDGNFYTHLGENCKSRMTLCRHVDKCRRLKETCILHLSGLIMKFEGAGVSKWLYLHSTTHDTKSPEDSNN